MGMTIYVSDEYCEMNADRDLSDEIAERIINIKTPRGDEVFDVFDNHISFVEESYEGLSPYEDYVYQPVKELLQIARENDFKVNGIVKISSDYSDYSNITMIIEDNDYRCCDTGIFEADTKTLLEELKRRGVLNDEIIGMLDYGDDEEDLGK